METKTVIKANVDNFEFGLWDDNFNLIPIDENNLEEMAERFGCSSELLDLIRDNFVCLKGELLEDLKDIWKKYASRENN